MPTYEYRCNKCGKTFEKLQSMTESPVKKCPRPKCGGTVQRLIGGGAGLIFKGTGFYQTDYKKSAPSETKSEKKPDAPPAKGGSASGGKPDKK